MYPGYSPLCLCCSLMCSRLHERASAVCDFPLDQLHDSGEVTLEEARGTYGYSPGTYGCSLGGTTVTASENRYSLM